MSRIERKQGVYEAQISADRARRAKLVKELDAAQYSSNDLEPVDAQIPEVVREQVCPTPPVRHTAWPL